MSSQHPQHPCVLTLHIDASSSSDALMLSKIVCLGLETREVMPVPALPAAGAIRPHRPSRPPDQLSALPALLCRTTPVPPPVVQ